MKKKRPVGSAGPLSVGAIRARKISRFVEEKTIPARGRRDCVQCLKSACLNREKASFVMRIAVLEVPMLIFLRRLFLFSEVVVSLCAEVFIAMCALEMRGWLFEWEIEVLKINIFFWYLLLVIIYLTY